MDKSPCTRYCLDRENVYRAQAAPDHEGSGAHGRRQPGNRFPRAQRLRRSAPGSGRTGPRRRQAARLPARYDRQHAAPRRPPVGEHRADHRGRLQPLLLGRAPRRRGRRPPARRAHLRRLLRRAARARGRARGGLRRARRRRPGDRALRERPELPAARPAGGDGARVRRPPAALHPRRRRHQRQRGRCSGRGRAPDRRRGTGGSASSATACPSSPPSNAAPATTRRSTPRASSARPSSSAPSSSTAPRARGPRRDPGASRTRRRRCSPGRT